MAESGSGQAPGTGRPSRRIAAVSVAVIALIFHYYWSLLSDGRFLRVKPVRYDLIFNSMIEYMSHGRFDVDPDVIFQEGFTREGRTYAYFGVVPALLRLPLLVLPVRFRTMDFTVIYCAIAATIAAAAQLAAVLQAGRAMGDVAYRKRALLFALATVIFGGSQLQFLRPSVYQESAFWAAAIAAMFVLLAFRWCIEPETRKSGHLMAMAVLAGLCLLTRVSTSIGLYAACGAIMLPEFITEARIRSSRLIQTILLPLAVLILFAAICGYINYARWGSPLTFQDYRYYNILTVNDPAYDVLINYGYFHVRRIPFGLQYYFLPVWTIIGPDGHFLFRAIQDRLYYTVELPPATFFASDPLLCFLAVLGCARLRRDRSIARLVAVCFMVPGLLILMAIAATFRYRMEFYPFFEFLALFGLLSLPGKIVARPRLLTGACGLMIAVTIISSHVFLLAYKISPWGDSAVVEKIGWTAAYHEYFRLTYPGIGRTLQRD